MHCPNCGATTKVEETRTGSGGQVRRYRRCEKCGHRFATVEQLDLGSVRVRKRDGRIESFNRRKIVKSVMKATVRELPTAELNELCDRVIQAIFAEGNGGLRNPDSDARTIESKRIGQLVFEVLGSERKLQVVQARYALMFEAENGSFSDSSSFLRWLEDRGTETPHSIALPAQVLKKDGSIERFDPTKLKESIRYAAKKKPNTDEERQLSGELGDFVYTEVMSQISHQALVTSGQLATEVMRVFHPRTGPKISPDVLTSGERELAYLRVASTAKDFGWLEDFAAEAAGLAAPTVG